MIQIDLCTFLDPSNLDDKVFDDDPFMSDNVDTSTMFDN